MNHDIHKYIILVHILLLIQRYSNALLCRCFYFSINVSRHIQTRSRCKVSVVITPIRIGIIIKCIDCYTNTRTSKDLYYKGTSSSSSSRYPVNRTLQNHIILVTCGGLCEIKSVIHSCVPIILRLTNIRLYYDVNALCIVSQSLQLHDTRFK